MGHRQRSGEGCCSAFLRCLLKLSNFLLSFVGVALLLYSLYVMRDLPSSSSSTTPHFGSWGLPNAWFAYFLLGVGCTICGISIIGHLAAETRNGCCLSTYVFFLVIMMLLQGGFVMNALMNEDWQESIPSDPTGLLESVKQFIANNTDLCKWASLTLIVTEGAAAVLASCIRVVAPTSCCGACDSDNDDEFENYAAYVIPQSAIRQPLMKHGRDPESLNMGTVQGFPYQVIPSNATARDRVLNKYTK